MVDALYTRVSTDMQVEHGESMDTQKEKLLEHARHNNLAPELYEDPGYSAKDMQRPALLRLLSDIRDKKVRSLTVNKIDRLTRNIRDLLHLMELFEEYDIVFKSLTQQIDTSTPIGRMLLRLLVEFAQMEREMTSERVGEDMRHRAKSGKWNGGVIPYGFGVVDKQLVEEPSESAIINLIFNKYVERESLRAVTHWLNTNNYRTRNSATWATSSVRRVLTNPTYIGKACYNRRVSAKSGKKMKARPKSQWIIVDGLHKGIVGEETFNTAQDILKQQYKVPRRKFSEYLLSGLLRCGYCGGSMNGYGQQRIRKSKVDHYFYYNCHNHVSKGNSVCKGQMIVRHLIEDAVVKTIMLLWRDQDYRIKTKRALDEYNSQAENGRSPLNTESDSLRKRNGVIEGKRRILLENLENRCIDGATYKNRDQELLGELESNKGRIYAIESQLNSIQTNVITFEAVCEALKNFELCWDGLELPQKKDVLASIINSIAVYKDRIEIKLYFLPELHSTNVSSEGSKENVAPCLRKVTGS